MNIELKELPNHAHYPVCLDRMCSIDAFCRKQSGFTLAASFLMTILTWFTVRFPVISVIPNLIGDSTEAVPNIVQTFLILAMALLSVASVLKYKIFSVVLFVIYAVMFIFGCVSYEPMAYFSIIIGFIGTMFSFRAVGFYLDYKQLCQTEGFPDFNERFTYQNEHGDYISRFEKNVRFGSDGRMSEPEFQPGNCTTDDRGHEPTAEMDSI